MSGCIICKTKQKFNNSVINYTPIFNEFPSRGRKYVSIEFDYKDKINSYSKFLAANLEHWVQNHYLNQVDFKFWLELRYDILNTIKFGKNINIIYTELNNYVIDTFIQKAKNSFYYNNRDLILDVDYLARELALIN